MDIRGIITGWANLTLKELNSLSPEIRQMGEKRLKICHQCPVRTGNRCDPNKTIKNKDGDRIKGCGCVLSAKVLSPSSKCPAGKW